MKKYVVSLLVVAVLIGAGFVLREESRRAAFQRDIQTARAAREATESEFATCAQSKLSKKGMEELVMARYQPAGIEWEELTKKMPGWRKPSGSELGPMEPKRVSDWRSFEDLPESCGLEGSFERYAGYYFWDRMSQHEEYRKVLTAVTKRNDDILAPFRAAEEKLQRQREETKKARNAELFKPD